MSTSRICRMASMAAFVAMIFVVASPDVSTQSQTAKPAAAPPAPLGILAPANIAKPRPKAPFDLTGTWLHNSPTGARFDPPAGFKLTPAAQAHSDPAQKPPTEGTVYG